MQEMKKIAIDTLSEGAALERIALEFTKVLENIMDENTSPKAIREINLKVKIKPTEDRTAGEVLIQATSKLAPVVEHVTQIYIGKDMRGTPEASEIIQPELFPEMSNITQIKKEGTTDV